MHKLNLIPEEFLDIRKKKRYRFFYTLLGLALLTFFSLSLALFHSALENLNRELQEVEKLLNIYRSPSASGQNLEKIYSDLHERRRIKNALQIHRVKWSTYIQKIMEASPPDIFLYSLGIDSKGNGIVRGISSSNLSIGHMIDKLKQIDDFSEVKLGFIKKEKEKNYYTFEVYFRVQGNDAIKHQAEPA